jgi:RND family efflux transporter MFP subunit
MKRFHWSVIFSLTAILALLVSPASAAPAGNILAEGSVVASAVVVPAQVSQMGFLVSGLAGEIPVKEGDRVRAGQTLMVLETPELHFAVVASEAALRSAQSYAELQRYKRVKDRRGGRVFFDIVPPEVRQRADAKVQQAQAALEIAQADLAQGTLVAPYDGIVVSVTVIPGEFVQQNQVVVTLATLHTLQIETVDLSERDIPKVKIGDPASIFIEALNADIHGKVTSISPIANTLGGDVVYTVTVSLDEQPDGLLWGMTAEVTIGK